MLNLSVGGFVCEMYVGTTVQGAESNRNRSTIDASAPHLHFFTFVMSLVRLFRLLKVHLEAISDIVCASKRTCSLFPVAGKALTFIMIHATDN